MKVKPYFLSACKGIPFRILYISSFLIVIIFLSSNTVHDVVRDPLIESTHVSAETLTIKLSKPLHRFHSDHWFHIAEYYLINNDKIICASSNATEDIIKEKHKSAIICPGPSAVVIVAPEDPKFLKKLTKVTFFLLLLSFTDENISTALVVNHDFISQPHISRTVFGNIVSLRYLRWIHFLPPPVVFLQYDIMKPINERFLAPSELTHKFFSENVKTLSPMNSFNTGDIPNNSDRWFTSKDQVRRFRSKIHHLCDCPTSMTRPSQLEARSDTAASQTPCSPNSQSLLIRAAHPNILVSRKLNGIFLSLPLAVVRPLKVQPKIRGIRRYRMVIYERNSNRRFSDLEETLELLSKYTDNQTDTITGEIIFWDIDVIYHSDDMNPCLLDVALRSANILITTHGFQSTALIFMKSGAVLIEVFPYKYFKESYVKLSGTYGIHHRWIRNSFPTSLSRQALRFIPLNVCMLHRRCRSHARGDSVHLTHDDLQFIINVIKEVQEGIIGENNAPYQFQ